MDKLIEIVYSDFWEKSCVYKDNAINYVKIGEKGERKKWMRIISKKISLDERDIYNFKLYRKQPNNLIGLVNCMAKRLKWVSH